METLPEQVRPGDLITADFMNRLLARLGALETRVDDLEGGASDGAVRITQLIPAGTPASPLRLNDTLQILGENFGFSDGGHRVYFDSTPVTGFGPGSSDIHLLVTVPDTLSVPEGGRMVTLTVSNSVTTDSRAIMVLPLAPGNLDDVDVLWRDDEDPNPDPNPIPAPQSGAPQTVTFHYRLRSRAAMAAVFTVTPTVSVGAWQGSVQVLNGSGGVIGNRQITLQPLQEVDFAVRLTAAAPAPASGSFTLAVVASSGPLSGSLQREFTFEEEVEQGDPQIVLAFTNAEVLDSSTMQPASSGGSYNPSTSTISVAPGRRVQMAFAATFLTPGRYHVTLENPPATTGWTLTVRNPVGGQYPDENETPPIPELPEFSVQPTAGASASGQVTFRIQRQGETRSQSRTYTLARL